MKMLKIAAIVFISSAALVSAQTPNQALPVTPNPGAVPTIGGGGAANTTPPTTTTTTPAKTTPTAVGTAAPATTTSTASPATPKTTAAPGTTAGTTAADIKAPAATDVKKEMPIAPKSIDGIDNDTYVIGAQDTINVSVWKEPDLSGALPVRPDGMVSMSLLNDVRAAGFTPMQLAADITERLRKFIQDPQVSVTVTGVNSKRVFILGEVGRPGPMQLQPGMTVLQALASSGGLSAFANGKKIYILRAENGTQEKLWFNYKKAIKGDNSKNIFLKSGDTIVVP